MRKKKIQTKAVVRKGPQTQPSGLRLHALAIKEAIERTISSVFGVSSADLQTSNRGRAQIAFARQTAMYLAHVACELSLSEVGRLFGRDRTTVAHACHRVEDCRDDPLFDRTLELLEGAIHHFADWMDMNGIGN